LEGEAWTGAQQRMHGTCCRHCRLVSGIRRQILRTMPAC
jgi:hypothetical protein